PVQGSPTGFTTRCYAGHLQWHAQSKPHSPCFGTPPHVIPGGQVPHLQKLHVRPLSLASPHGIDSPVHAHDVPVDVHDMPDGQIDGIGGHPEVPPQFDSPQ